MRPDPEFHGEQPEDGALPSGRGDAGEFTAQQGLHVTSPVEHILLAGFVQDGAADTMAPGGLLATIVHAATGEDGSGLTGCSDDQLIGMISAARRLESRAAWTLMAAMAEFAGLRPPQRGRGGGSVAEFAADEIAAELRLTPQSAAAQIELACTVSRRLPAAVAALAAGKLHPVDIRIIEEETR